MTSKIKKIGVLTSGGDSPGMNAAVRAVVRSAEFHKIDCFGIYKGYEGLISDEIKKLNARSVKNIVNKGGTILKSARCLEFRTEEGRVKAKNNLDKYGINSLIIIGGNGSLLGGKIFEEEHGINVVGIGYTIYVGSEFEHEMLSEAAQFIRQAHELGMISVVWMYPRGKAVSDEKDPQLISGAAGVATCIGADFAKVECNAYDLTNFKRPPPP